MSTRLHNRTHRLGSQLFAILMVLALLSAALPSAAYAATPVAPTPDFTLEKSGTKLTVTVEEAQKNADYFVKIDDASKGGFEWIKLSGVLETDSSGDAEDTFILSTKQSKIAFFNVCLKNIKTDDLICSIPALTVMRGEDDDDDKADVEEEDGTFTVTRLGDEVLVKTSGFTKNTSYFVKAAEKTAGQPDWFMLGTLKTKSSTSGSYLYKLPKELRSIEDLNICLKNAKTNTLTCVLNQQ